MRTFLLLLLSLPCTVFSQHKLTIDVEGVPNSDGNIMVALYDSSDYFLKMEHVFKTDGAHAHQGTTRVTMENIPDGEYAIAVFHDANGNDELDTNWLGIPKETVGFSNAKMKMFGPPNFKECSFRMAKDTSIIVSL